MDANPSSLKERGMGRRLGDGMATVAAVGA
jgi:hypothetical protein